VNVVVDTPVWSLALRRKPSQLSAAQRVLIRTWEDLVRRRQAILLGPIRLELLSGVRDAAIFERLRRHLRAFDDEALAVEDYEEAARCYNLCRAAGVAGSTIDFLLCAAAIRRQAEIFTTDKDFARYAEHLPLRLFDPGD
jgi:predicted nucleic acid-binding protein